MNSSTDVIVEMGKFLNIFLNMNSKNFKLFCNKLLVPIKKPSVLLTLKLNQLKNV